MAIIAVTFISFTPVNTCQEKRDEFHRVRDRYRFDQSDGTKEELNLTETAFRRQMNSSFKKIQENNAAKLREASKKDTNKMWKILNNMNACKKENVDIPIDTLYEYLKKLNEKMKMMMKRALSFITFAIIRYMTIF